MLSKMASFNMEARNLAEAGYPSLQFAGYPSDFVRSRAVP